MEKSVFCCVFFFSSRRRHTRYIGDWSSDVCSSDLLSPADRIVVPGLPTTLDLGHAAAGIRTIYQGLLTRAWADARARGEKLPPISQKNIPPTVPGQQ